MAPPAWTVDGINNGLSDVPLGTTANVQDSVGENVHLLVAQQHSDGHKAASPAKHWLAGAAFPARQASEQLNNDAEEMDPIDGVEDGAKALKAHQDVKWIILPRSKFRRIWIQVTIVVALYIIWVTPIRVGFDLQAQGPWFWIEGIIDLFFYTDLVLNFFTAYENPVTSEVIIDHKRIAWRYMSSWFWVDVLATFPSDYIIKGVEGTWECSFRNDCEAFDTGNTAFEAIELLRLTRIFRVIWIFKNFDLLSASNIIGRITDYLVSMRWVISMLELLLVLIFMGHLCGCFFYMFSHPRWQTEVEQELVAEGHMSTWVLDKTGGYEDPATGDWYSCPDLYWMEYCASCRGRLKLRCNAELGLGFRYVSAMYWAYTTMTTVGYGDIYATTVAEKIWAMTTMVIGGFFLSFCFGRIASIVSRLDADRAARAEQVEEVSQFLEDHELPKPISRRVLDFFNTNVKSVKPYDRAAVLARMPFELRAVILQHLYDTCIKSIPMLEKICKDDPAFMTDFTIKLQPYHTTVDTFVYQKGEVASDLYILVRGQAHVVGEDRATRLVKIPEGGIFGEGGLVLRLQQGDGKVRCEESVRCDTPCDMLRLPLDDAVELCEMYPELARGLKRVHKTRKAQLQSQTAPPRPTSVSSAPTLTVEALARSHVTTSVPQHPPDSGAYTRLTAGGS